MGVINKGEIMLPTKDILRIIGTCFLFWFFFWIMIYAIFGIDQGRAAYLAGVPAAILLSVMTRRARDKDTRD